MMEGVAVRLQSIKMGWLTSNFNFWPPAAALKQFRDVALTTWLESKFRILMNLGKKE